MGGWRRPAAGGGGGGSGGAFVADLLTAARDPETSLRVSKPDWDGTWRLRTAVRALNRQADLLVPGQAGGLHVAAAESWRLGASGNNEQLAFMDRGVPAANLQSEVLLPTTGGSGSPGIRAVMPDGFTSGGSPVYGVDGARGDDWRFAVQTASQGAPYAPGSVHIGSTDSASGAGITLTTTEAMQDDGTVINTGWHIRLVRRQHAVPASGQVNPPPIHVIGNRITIQPGDGARYNDVQFQIVNLPAAAGLDSYVVSGSNFLQLNIKVGDTIQKVINDITGHVNWAARNITLSVHSTSSGSDVIPDFADEAHTITGGSDGSTGETAQPLQVTYTIASSTVLRITLRANQDHTMQEIRQAVLAAPVPASAVDTSSVWTWLATQVTITGADDATIPFGTSGFPNAVGNSRDYYFSGAASATEAQDAALSVDVANKLFTFRQAHDATPAANRTFLEGASFGFATSLEGTNPSGLLTEGTYDFSGGRNAVWARTLGLAPPQAGVAVWCDGREGRDGLFLRMKNPPANSPDFGVAGAVGAAGNAWSLSVAYGAFSTRVYRPFGNQNLLELLINTGGGSELTEGDISAIESRFDVIRIGNPVGRTLTGISRNAAVSFAGGADNVEANVWLNSADAASAVASAMDADARLDVETVAASGSATLFASATSTPSKALTGGVDEQPLELVESSFTNAEGDQATEVLFRYNTTVDRMRQANDVFEADGYETWPRGSMTLNDVPEPAGWVRNVGAVTRPGATAMGGLTSAQVQALIDASISNLRGFRLGTRVLTDHDPGAPDQFDVVEVPLTLEAGKGYYVEIMEEETTARPFVLYADGILNNVTARAPETRTAELPAAILKASFRVLPVAYTIGRVTYAIHGGRTSANRLTLYNHHRETLLHIDSISAWELV